MHKNEHKKNQYEIHDSGREVLKACTKYVRFLREYNQ